MRNPVLFVLLFPALCSLAQKQPMLVTDMLKIKQVGNVSLTKDGATSVFTVNAIIPDPASKLDYKYQTQIYSVSTDGSTPPKQLTTTKESSVQPVLSPDGKQLAFVRAVDGKPQVFILSLEGGEPIQLTKFSYGAGSPKWSPDGKTILFSASINLKEYFKDSLLNPSHTGPVWPFEKPGITNREQFAQGTARPDPDGSISEVRAYLEQVSVDKKAKVIDKLNFQDESNINAESSFSHFFIIGTEPGASPKAVTRGFYRFTNADFTPDGKRLLMSGDIDSLQHPDRSLESEIFMANADGSALKMLIGEDGKTFGSAVISPSGKLIAFLFGTTSFVNVPALAIMPIDGTIKDMITIPFDRSKSNLTWSSDESYIYFSAQSNGGAPVYRADIKTKKVEQLSDFAAGVLNFDMVGGKIAFVQTAVADPSALFVADASMKNVKKLSSFNDWVQTKKLSLPEKKYFVNNKGLTIEYWVMKPTDYQPGKKYPLLLDIHGGPSAMWGPGEASMWHEFQYFCSKGYGVVYCNPRGSGGYGQTFLRANINDWGTGPASDVLTVVDKTIAEGWADTSKLVTSGGSYAGYLVAWLISHDHRFKAASSQRGVYDLTTFFGEGNAWRLVPNYFGGYPWEPKVKEVLTRESPFTYVSNIRTPYLIFHGDNDRRTGFVQGEMMYRSLKVLGRPVEYVRHADGTHELSRAGDNRQRIDQMLRTWEFFERFLR